MAFDIDTMFAGRPRMLNIDDGFDIDTMFDGRVAIIIPTESGGTGSDWTGTIIGVTDPAKINGITVANISTVNGI